MNNEIIRHILKSPAPIFIFGGIGLLLFSITGNNKYFGLPFIIGISIILGGHFA